MGNMYSDPIIDEVEEPPTSVTALQMSKCALLSPQSSMMDMPKCQLIKTPTFLFPFASQSSLY